MAHNIWYNSVPYLKVNITSKKPIPVAGDLVKVLEDIVNLHKDIYLTSDILFVNIIPLFITLSRKICFIAVNHIPNREVETIFMAFIDIYSY